ncbi:type 1 glutamine amidotransferase [Cellulomonas sp. S1-8]|uniref:type 1 glutamine amidotransferase n=1 Tax=Cellulomonas sp. S1-8 TaxID=2904790 RepID=UPI0022444688|nr:type 1 glutamine amidotransferase [Cellulomonas sp. S1-8]UZN04099.1 type 1 glutamine amidotransferase [Cellulomonas sp. S1-8]
MVNVHLSDRRLDGATTGTAPVVTVVQSAPDVGLDRFAEWLPGLEVRLVRADLGEPLPGPAEVGDGLLVLGGQMSARDDVAAPWLRSLRDLLAVVSATDVPALGICLGAQLLAIGRGGRVEVAAPPGREAGVVDVRWRPEAATDALVAPLVQLAGAARTSPLPSMHADAVVDLPRGAVWLASSSMYPFQAFRIGSAWGVQFHPEAGLATMRAWADAHDDVDTEAVVAQMTARAEAVETSGRAVADAFAHLVRDRAAARHLHV